ncbi:thioredoxin reductase [Cavenderia fasciculata]|uniref:Thioredoxin reductase n=1 Tax=Cavenderia fasciculata TaxID=261658 RepID=F4Q1M8_CACFS|nr:thioredoxin reductase [Cavenderia fasciculata]EGG18729.1 thioredoxin reductase [Cavenderia fasciculata]|eukprot:XP_004366633.1 thioredoxin reductase [Cavenderia fasciculata]
MIKRLLTTNSNKFIQSSSSQSQSLFRLNNNNNNLYQYKSTSTLTVNNNNSNINNISYIIRRMSTEQKIEKVVIVGSGPAGHTAAIYTGRARLEPIMFEGFMAGGVAAGGQLTTTTEIENFPGFAQQISGPELMDRMREQSVHCGTRIETKNVLRMDLSKRPFTLYIEDEEDKPVLAETVIIATGATAKKMGVPGEEEYWSRGISACAVCDGALPIYRNKHLVVVGGGDTACEEATFLTHFASKVSLLVRRDEMRASKAMQQRVLANPKITIVWNTELVSARGDGKLLTHVTVQTKGKEPEELAAQGLFYAIGHVPNTAFLNNQITLDETGYIITQGHSTKTNIEGVFACGDVQDKIYRQAITAAGTGCMAALEAERFLSEQH